tara:strand:+ start:4700 stop:6010 length:1311 start_codon:yes stop_codon:yes gene_type:complete
MQQTVRLLGDLGERYGSEHTYHDLRSPAEAIKLLCINKPEFQKELLEAHTHGIGYTLVQADEYLTYDDLHLPLGKNDLVLTPVVAGSGGGSSGGFFSILIGVGLVAASFLLPGSGLFGASAFGVLGPLAPSTIATLTTVGTAISAIGASLVLTGVAQMLAPQPVIPTLKGRASGDRTNSSRPQGVSRAFSGEQSYAFTGPANTVGVGATVPLVYGKLLIGSHLISSRVDVTSESNPTGDFFGETGASSVTVNGEKPKFKFRSHNGTRTRRYTDSNVKYAGDYKKRPNREVLFESRDSYSFAKDHKEFGINTRRPKNFQVFLEIDNGLSRVIGSQTVPAFVTYEIIIKKRNYDGESPVFGRVRVTIQGLLKDSQSYKWAHAMAYGHSGAEDSDTTLDPTIRIIDTDATEGQRLVVRAAGYAFFEDKAQNDTEHLTDS